jgi:hypothetical protein
MTMDDRIFIEAMASVGEHDFMVLGAGFVTVRLWRGLSADRLTPEQIRAIQAAQRSVGQIPDRWRHARAALFDALDAITSVDAEVVAQTALARYAGAIARLAPDITAAVLRQLRCAATPQPEQELHFRSDLTMLPRVRTDRVLV